MNPRSQKGELIRVGHCRRTPRNGSRRAWASGALSVELEEIKAKPYHQRARARVQYKLSKKLALLIALTLAGGCGNTAVPDTGSLEAPLGASATHLVKNGFTCSDSECRRESERYVGPLDDPAAAKPSVVKVELSDGVASVVTETYLDQSDDAAITLLTEKYGEPQLCRYRNALMAEIEFYVWKARSGSTVSVSKIANYGMAMNLGGLSAGVSSIEYRDTQRSDEFWSERCSNWK